MQINGSISPFPSNHLESQGFQRPKEKNLINKVKDAVSSNPIKSLLIGSSVALGVIALGAYYFDSSPGSNPTPTPSPSGSPTPTPSPKDNIPEKCQIPSGLTSDELIDKFVSQSHENDLSMLNCNVECPQSDLNEVYKMLNSSNLDKSFSLKSKKFFVGNCLRTNHPKAQLIVEKYIKNLLNDPSNLENLETAGKFVKNYLNSPSIQTSIPKVVETLEKANKAALRPLVSDIRKTCGQVPPNNVAMFGCHNLV